MVRRRLLLQLFLVVFVASVLPLLGAAVLSLEQQRARIERNLQRDHVELAQTASTLIGAYVANASEKIAAISTVLAQRGALADEDLARQLSDLLLPSDEFLGLRYEDTAGAQPRQAAVSQSIGQQELQIKNTQQQGSFQGQTMVTEPEQLGTNNPQLRSFLDVLEPGKVRLANGIQFLDNGALPLNVRVDRVRTLSADLRLDPLSNTLEELTRNSEREVVLLHPEGERVLAASSPDLHPEWFETRHAGPEGWVILVREPEEIAQAPLREARQQTVLWALAGTGLAALFSLLFASWILRPIRALTQAAEALQAGELSTRVGIERADEIGQLARAFDAMAAAVESLDRAKSEFVRTVSHELRTPLTAMKVSVENLIDGVGSEETLPRLRQDIDRLIRLVNELLELARLEADVSAFELGAHELREIVMGCQLSLRPLLEAKKLEVEVETTPGATRCDPNRMRQVVTNLLDNAIKHTPPEGTIRFELAPGRLVISDSGPGVPPERAEEIFRPFAEGGGIGLTIAREIVRHHGGAISVEGSRFTVELPGVA